MVHLRCQKTKDNFTACENYAAAHHFCLTSALSTCIRLTSVRQEPPAVPPDQRWRSHCCYRQLQQPCESVSSLAAAASQDLPGKTVAQQHEKQLKHNKTETSSTLQHKERLQQCQLSTC